MTKRKRNWFSRSNAASHRFCLGVLTKFLTLNFEKLLFSVFGFKIHHLDAVDPDDEAIVQLSWRWWVDLVGGDLPHHQLAIERHVFLAGIRWSSPGQLLGEPAHENSAVVVIFVLLRDSRVPHCEAESSCSSCAVLVLLGEKVKHLTNTGIVLIVPEHAVVVDRCLLDHVHSHQGPVRPMVDRDQP